MSIKERIIGLLLHVANTQAAVFGHHAFYDLKTRLLKQHGRLVRHDLQHIVKRCYECETGCRRCNRYGKGGGVWDEFWVWLECYTLGGYEFHIPRERGYSKPSARVTIEGYVRHERYPYYLAAECSYWLYLMFDREAFKGSFGHVGHCSRKVTPMVWAGTLLFYWRGKGYRWQRFVSRLRRRYSEWNPRGLTILKIEEPDDIPF